MCPSNDICGSMEQIPELSRNVSTGLQVSSAQWNTIQKGVYGIHAGLMSADMHRDGQWPTIRASLDQTKATCDVTQASIDKQPRAISTKLNGSRAESKGVYQGIENRLLLILEAVQSLTSRMAISRIGVESHTTWGVAFSPSLPGGVAIDITVQTTGNPSIEETLTRSRTSSQS